MTGEYKLWAKEVSERIAQMFVANSTGFPYDRERCQDMVLSALNEAWWIGHNTPSTNIKAREK